MLSVGLNTSTLYADLDHLCSADTLLLDVPEIDWSFGSIFMDEASASRPDKDVDTATSNDFHLIPGCPS